VESRLAKSRNDHGRRSRRTQDRRIWFGEGPGFRVSRGKGTGLLNVEVPNHERHLLALAHGHEEVITWREVKGVAKNLNPFLGFGNLKDKEPGRARMQES
jgi:hypothetical protein